MSTVRMPLVLPAASRRKLPAGLLALARIEGRRLLRHPAFLVGVALSLAFLRDMGDGASLGAFLDGFALLPVAAGTLVAANLAALRSRRSGTDELYGSLPRQHAMRVGGQLLALVWTLPVSTALIALAYVADSFDEYARHAGPGIVFIAQGPMMVVACGAVGILLARMAPYPLVGPLLIVALFALRIVVTSPDSWVAWVLPFAGGTAQAGAPVACDPAISADPNCMMFVNELAANMHLAYLVGLALLVGAAAVVARRPLRVAALGALTAALATVTKLAVG